MNRLLSRMWQIVAVLVILTVTGIYLYFRFVGLSHPFAKLIGAYKYHVATLVDMSDTSKTQGAFTMNTLR